MFNYENKKTAYHTIFINIDVAINSLEHVKGPYAFLKWAIEICNFKKPQSIIINNGSYSYNDRKKIGSSEEQNKFVFH